MAIDFQLVFPQEAIQLNSVRVVPGLVPRTIEVIGEDFRSVDEVLINKIVSPDIVVFSKTRLLAQVPDIAVKDTLFSVSVLSRKLSLSHSSTLRFRIGKVPGKVRGILKLVQLFLKILFTAPGTDIFNSRIGGGGLKSLGATFGLDEGGWIVSSFVISVDSTARQIVAIQSRDSSLPTDERLLAAKIVSAGFNKSEGALIVSLEITSQAGRAAVANLEL